MAKKRLKAAIYCRISQDRNNTREKVEYQKEVLEEYCEHFGWAVYKTYIDNDKSAFKGHVKRPEWEKMLKDFRAKKFDIICAWRVDRMSRNPGKSVVQIEELRDLGLRIFTTELTEDADLTDDEKFAWVIDRINDAFKESAIKSVREKAASKRRLKKGMNMPGSRAFGYDTKQNIIPEEAEIVRAIYREYQKGATMSAITRAINGDTTQLPYMPHSQAPSVVIARYKGEKVPDKPWGLAATQNILANPRYAGFVCYAPTIKGKCQSYQSHWEDFIVKGEGGVPIKAAWEPIIDEDVWREVQRKRKANKFRKNGDPIERSGFPRKYFGSGVYRCSICGGPMKSGDGSYRCDGHVTRMREKVDDFVLTVIRERLERADLKDLLAEPEDKERTKALDEELSVLRARLAATEEDYMNDVIDGEIYARKSNMLKGKIHKAEEERLKLLPNNAGIAVLTAKDPVKAFDELKDPSQIAEVINFFCTVTLKPHERGKRNTPESLAEDVLIEWK